MATVYDIIKGIHQAAANAYDGSQYERYSYDGEERKCGLKREEGDPIIDSRVMDGFGVRISGPKLIVSYQSELPIKSFHNSKLDDEIESIFAGIAKFLKKEYKAITGDTLALKSDAPCEILLQNMSRIRTWCQCKKVYTIGGLKDTEAVGENLPGDSEEKLRAAVKKWLEIGKPKYGAAKKSNNVKA